MEDHFSAFRKGIIGIDKYIPSPDGEEKRIVYADWTASGRNYGPIEDRIRDEIMPYVANTHTETSATGMAMTHAYLTARQIIKKHVNASPDDVIITAGSGMTGLVNKLQRILNLRLPEKYFHLPPNDQRPVVFVTHMEHHSN
ncbi:MAG: aminotransferase class V-fold PLP-dependent enzyme, partial [Cyclobacteriaceae bacterium]